MVKYCFLIIGFLLLSNPSKSLDTLKVRGVVYHGDTIMSAWLKTILITDFRPFKDYEQQRLYKNLISDVQTVYPYAKKTAYLLNEIKKELANCPTRKERKRYLKSKEEELNKQFKDQLVNMTTHQGRLLILLINRETGSSCYEVIKEFKGGFKTFAYNLMMSTYDDDLNMKRKYNADEQFMLERAIAQIEATQPKK
jgi:hypothetical protein